MTKKIGKPMGSKACSISDIDLRIRGAAMVAMVGTGVLKGSSSSALLVSSFYWKNGTSLPLLLANSYSTKVVGSCMSCTHSTRAAISLRKRRCLWECFSTTADTNSTTSLMKDEMPKIKEAANTLDIRVGKILKAWRHEEADTLYVEEVDLGEPEPRIICSGLVKYVPLDQFQDINVVVLANLKPRNMRGVKSYGMLMAASDASHENVELLVPPAGSVAGERIWFGSADETENLPDVASPNQIQKKKIWELVQPHLRTDDSCTAALGMYTMRTSGGVVVCRSLKNARIS